MIWAHLPLTWSNSHLMYHLDVLIKSSINAWGNFGSYFVNYFMMHLLHQFSCARATQRIKGILINLLSEKGRTTAIVSCWSQGWVHWTSSQIYVMSFIKMQTQMYAIHLQKLNQCIEYNYSDILPRNINPQTCS